MQQIVTRYGPLIPQHTADDLRKRDIIPVEYHANGHPKSLPLETSTIIPTPAGDIPAELVSFHDNGNISRVFPLNGKLSGYWSEADERELARPLTLKTPVGIVTATVISVAFYESGMLRSITLWPGETLSIPTPIGYISTRIGFSFAPDGSLHSLEPAKPTPVETRAGEIIAYDPDAVGLNGDSNSLHFNKKGEVCRITTVTTQLRTVNQDGRTTMHNPEERESLCGDEATETIPMTISFGDMHMSVWKHPEKPPTRVAMDSAICFTSPIIPEFSTAIPALKCC